MNCSNNRDQCERMDMSLKTGKLRGKGHFYCEALYPFVTFYTHFNLFSMSACFCTPHMHLPSLQHDKHGCEDKITIVR